jgi:hypothetical protein
LASDLISPYQYLYFGQAGVGYAIYGVTPFPINYVPQISGIPILPYDPFITPDNVNSLGLEAEFIENISIAAGVNVIPASYWQPADFDQSHQRSPVNKLGIHNSIKNNRWSLALQGGPGWHPAAGISADFGAILGYRFEAEGHSVARIDLEDPTASGWVSNTASPQPFLTRPYPDNSNPPFRIGWTAILANSFTSDLIASDGQNPYYIMNPDAP